MNASVKLGATLEEGSRCDFLVWAPAADTVDVQIVSTRERRLSLERRSEAASRKTERRVPSSVVSPATSVGYFHGIFEGVEPESLYFYVIDGNLIPSCIAIGNIAGCP